MTKEGILPLCHRMSIFGILSYYNIFVNVADAVDVCMQLNTRNPLRLGPTQAVEMGNIGAPELPKQSLNLLDSFSLYRCFSQGASYYSDIDVNLVFPHQPGFIFRLAAELCLRFDGQAQDLYSIPM